MASLEVALGGIIAELRRRAGLSQEALAHAAGVHPTYISQLERGLKSPTVRVLGSIAAGLGTSASKLLARAEAVAR